MWLRERQLPFALARLADPTPIAHRVAEGDPPATFRYRSIRPAFSIFGYDVHIDRDVLEFLDLRNVSSGGLTLQGTGRASITTAPVYDPGATYRLTGASDPLAVADAGGRLHLVVDLGPSHQAEQFSPAARAVQDLPGYMSTRTVTIAKVPVSACGPRMHGWASVRSWACAARSSR
jgi:hypothetical protein